MKTSLAWDDVIATYERDLEILEAARSEYARSVDELLANLQRKLEMANMAPSLVEGVTLTFELNKSFDGIGQHVLECWLQVEDRRWANVHVWVASAWRGPPSTLRLAVGFDPNNDLLPFKGTELAEEARLCAGWKDIGLPSSAPDFDAFCPRVESLDLTKPDVVETAIPLVRELLEGAARIAASFAEKSRHVLRAVEALEACRKRAQGESLAPDQKIHPTKSTGRWRKGTIPYFEVRAGERPPILLGVDTVTRTFLYGHTSDPKRPDLAERLARELQCTGAARVLDGYTCRTLLDANALAAASPEAIETRAMDVLRSFMKLTNL
ncbi:MAG TPA: hypothetical protein VE093_48585 [Polyangiaceae bacterium]|jgi:hypothetical protein|nr:hypothetical protein [Polyangiaceae bacterium]